MEAVVPAIGVLRRVCLFAKRRGILAQDDNLSSRSLQQIPQHRDLGFDSGVQRGIYVGSKQGE